MPVQIRRTLLVDADAARFAELRRTEYRRLDDSGQVYLDYTGASLFAASQLREHVALLERTVLGNPHSVNPTSGRPTPSIPATGSC